MKFHFAFMLPSSLIASMVLSILFLAPVSAFAQFEIELPGVAGEYTEESVIGQFLIPETSGAGNARFVVEGSIIPGSTGYVGHPGRFPKGSEAHLLLYIGTVEGVLISAGSVGIPAEEGNFLVEGEMFTPYGEPSPLFLTSATIDFQLFIGYDPDSWPVGEILPIPSVVTVQSVQLVSDFGVGNEKFRWGTVKGMFR